MHGIGKDEWCDFDVIKLAAGWGKILRLEMLKGYCWMLGNAVGVGLWESLGSSGVVCRSWGDSFRQSQSVKFYHMICYRQFGLDNCGCC